MCLHAEAHQRCKQTQWLAHAGLVPLRGGRRFAYPSEQGYAEEDCPTTYQLMELGEEIDREGDASEEGDPGTGDNSDITDSSDTETDWDADLEERSENVEQQGDDMTVEAQVRAAQPVLGEDQLMRQAELRFQRCRHAEVQDAWHARYDPLGPVIRAQYRQLVRLRVSVNHVRACLNSDDLDFQRQNPWIGIGRHGPWRLMRCSRKAALESMIEEEKRIREWVRQLESLMWHEKWWIECWNASRVLSIEEKYLHWDRPGTWHENWATDDEALKEAKTASEKAARVHQLWTRDLPRWEARRDQGKLWLQRNEIFWREVRDLAGVEVPRGGEVVEAGEGQEAGVDDRAEKRALCGMLMTRMFIQVRARKTAQWVRIRARVPSSM